MFTTKGVGGAIDEKAGEDAMKSGLLVLDHRVALRISSNVTRNIRQLQGRTKVDIQPREVIKILNKARIRFTLVEAHGIAGWLLDPRASQDVDVIIHAQHKKAVQAVRKAFPNLRVAELMVVTRFVDPATARPVIDLMKPDSDLHQNVADHTVQVGRTHRVPDLEMALALKFAAMESPYRNEIKKGQDAVDFASMAAAHGDEIADGKLFNFGEMVKSGGGKAILKLVEEAKAAAERSADEQ